MPIIPPPLWEASDENVITTVTARGISQFTILSLAEFGQPSQQPNASASAEPAAVAMATDPPKDLLPPLPEFPVLKDDNILIDNNQNMPIPAKIVE